MYINKGLNPPFHRTDPTEIDICQADDINNRLHEVLVSAPVLSVVDSWRGGLVFVMVEVFHLAMV